MRVITGIYKNRLLFQAPRKYRIRATTAVVKKAIIDIFRNFIENSTILDIFSGTGGMGIEFLSNNAKFVTFIESSYHNVNLIKRNLENLKIEESKYLIIKKDFKVAIPFIAQTFENKFDFIFIDPPYFTDYIKESLQLLSQFEIYKKDVVVIAEHHKKEKIEEQIGRFKKYDTRAYGTSVVEFFKISN